MVKKVKKKQGKNKVRKKKKVEREKAEEEIKIIPRKKQERQIRMFVFVMIFLLVFIFIVYSFIQATLKFSYAGLEFEKVRQGQLILYKTPIFPIYFRYDPRQLRDIDVEGKIMLQKEIGIGGSLEIIDGCEDSTLAATTLSIFFGKTGLKPFSATHNETEAEKFNITYLDCNLNSEKSGIFLEKGEENKIKRKGQCYVLEVKSCSEIMKVTERFIIASYAHSRNIEV